MVGLEEEVEWLSVIDEEDDPHAFLGEEDDWGEDLDEETDKLPNHAGALQSGDNVLFEGEEMRGTPRVGHRLLHILCRNLPQSGL